MIFPVYDREAKIHTSMSYVHYPWIIFVSWWKSTQQFQMFLSLAFSLSLRDFRKEYTWVKETLLWNLECASVSFSFQTNFGASSSPLLPPRLLFISSLQHTGLWSSGFLSLTQLLSPSPFLNENHWAPFANHFTYASRLYNSDLSYYSE